MERAGWEAEELPEYQRRLFWDLHDPLDEEALADMLEYWTYDLDQLFRRERRGWGRGRAPAKPQIDVWVEVTSKGNLKAEWFPRGGTAHHLPNQTDMPGFRRSENRRIAFDSRPSNELFFLHHAESAQSHIQRPSQGPTAALDTPLLLACARVVERLKSRLDYHFDVRMRRDVLLEWSEAEDEMHPWRRRRVRLLKWEIVDPEERKRAAELDELNNLEERLGFSEQTLLEAKALVESRPPGKTGPPPSPHTLAERLARELKKRGCPATPTKVKRGLELLDRHRAPTNVISLSTLRPTSQDEDG